MECEVSTVRGSGWVEVAHEKLPPRRLLCRPLRGLWILGDMVPGLRSLRSLARG